MIGDSPIIRNILEEYSRYENERGALIKHYHLDQTFGESQTLWRTFDQRLSAFLEDRMRQVYAERELPGAGLGFDEKVQTSRQRLVGFLQAHLGLPVASIKQDMEMILKESKAMLETTVEAAYLAEHPPQTKEV